MDCLVLKWVVYSSVIGMCVVLEVSFCIKAKYLKCVHYIGEMIVQRGNNGSLTE